MDLAEAEPVWIDPGNENAVQLDLTGSRLPPQALEARTLDGITSVTRQSTYLGMRAWIVKRYYEAKQPDRYANFLAFAARQEAALAIGLVADNFDGLNLIGARGAKRAVDEGGSKMQLSALAKQKAVSIYGASFNTLGLGGQRDSGVPNLSEAGHELANAVETRVSASRYARKLAGDPQISSVATKDLIEFAGQMGFAGASGKERQLLFRILFGLDGKASYLPRRDTYAMLLLQQQNDPGSGDPEFLRAVVASGHFGDCLSKTVDDWAEYATLDLISRCHETGLAAVVAVLHSLRGENSRGALPELVLERAVSHESVEDLLSDLGFPGPDATVAQLRHALSDTCCKPSVRGSIRRWSKGWAEEDIVEALDNHSGSGGAGPLLAWCCAAQRIADPRKRRLDRRGLWSLSGSMIPFLEEYAERPVRSAMAAALRIVVMQHLRVTWERYADDPSINNALIATEQGRWSFVRSYVPGRMGRRLWTARGWLMQLGAFNETGLSATGNTVLQRILAKCEEAWS